MNEALFALKSAPNKTNTKETVKEVDDSGHTDSHVEHMETTEGEKSHVTSGSGVGVATPAPVSINVMQMVAGGSWHRSHHFSVSNEELEQMEAESTMSI